jgi:hypothetical protein
MFGGSCNFLLDQWRANVTYYVSEYAASVDAWEIWNEPNSVTSGWQINVDYLSIVQVASPIIRQYDPSAKIVLFGGLQLYTGSSETAYILERDMMFAQNLSKMGIAQYGDVISLHAYPWGKEFSELARDSYASSLEFYSSLFPKSMEIWVTETGQNVTTSGEEEQAQYLSEALDFFSSKVSHVFWYALHDDTVNGDFGLIQPSGVPRDAFTVLSGKLNR